MMANEKLKQFLSKKFDYHVWEMEKDQPVYSKNEHRSKAEAYKEILDELESLMGTEEPETITVHVQSLSDEKMKPEVPTVIDEFIEQMRKYYITPGFYDTLEAENAVLLHYTLRFLFSEDKMSLKTARMMKAVKEWLEDRNNYFVLIDAIKKGYIVKEQIYAIRLTEEAAEAFKGGNKKARYLKVSNHDDSWYFGYYSTIIGSDETEFNEQEKDMWMDKLKAIPVEAVRIDEIPLKP